jgi:hypothetical protein
VEPEAVDIRNDPIFDLRDRYVEAINEFSDATTAVNERLLSGGAPTAAELEREEEAREVLEALRREFFDWRSVSI